MKYQILFWQVEFSERNQEVHYVPVWLADGGIDPIGVNGKVLAIIPAAPKTVYNTDTMEIETV